MDLVTRGQAYCKIFPSVGALLLLFVKIKNKGGEEGYIYIYIKREVENFFFLFWGKLWLERDGRGRRLRENDFIYNNKINYIRGGYFRLTKEKKTDGTISTSDPSMIVWLRKLKMEIGDGKFPVISVNCRDMNMITIDRSIQKKNPHFLLLSSSPSEFKYTTERERESKRSIEKTKNQ